MTQIHLVQVYKGTDFTEPLYLEEPCRSVHPAEEGAAADPQDAEIEPEPGFPVLKETPVWMVSLVVLGCLFSLGLLECIAGFIH